MENQKLNILHISDVHFTLNDKTNTQIRITKALVDIITAYKDPIDYCVFTGDLANSALLGEYELAGKWLEELLMLSIISKQR